MFLFNSKFIYPSKCLKDSMKYESILFLKTSPGNNLFNTIFQKVCPIVMYISSIIAVLPSNLFTNSFAVISIIILISLMVSLNLKSPGMKRSSQSFIQGTMEFRTIPLLKCAGVLLGR
ncbi:hypothetical protein AR158_C671R [Paramecium bursaria Chlorella virus AR158]|uniref:hypothetical protein n=1 Tax=Paramecium bursaria Chlorella virus AR158 TaxID=380598 RepID=UPI00015AA832|nr:hypothetical protein AR158_C671R [Paramecium bursaria Chlorella virus AR158]ABU44216.1 hypothetical protein AR158_C671R [Paramecium bursaria Chlorella virus AR158]